MATETRFKKLIINGYTRQFIIKYKKHVPIDIINIILLFYTAWNELTPHTTPAIEEKLIFMQNTSTSNSSTIWYSTHYKHGKKGMVQYHCSSNTITISVKYPTDINVANHCCCLYKDLIYIVDCCDGLIYVFNPIQQIFTKQKSIPELGASASCVVIHDCIHFLEEIIIINYI